MISGRDAESASGALAEALIARCREGATQSCTWLNHFSALEHSRRGSWDSLLDFDFVGIDGGFLRWLVTAKSRTTADLTVPRLLNLRPGTRLVLIGGTPLALTAASSALMAISGSQVVATMDGYAGLKRGRALEQWGRGLDADVVIIGLGPGLQEDVALEICSTSRIPLVLTCGGFIDQIGRPRYYPSWAYPLGLNWLVRLAREPRRLWRRYTWDAFRAWKMRATLPPRVRALPGFRRVEDTLWRADV
jgi:UDP-N-acetyl-D-mannosaminuronic acid transferase (WecB/TagA/CpsF family)